MSKILTILLSAFAINAFAAETIKIYSPYSPAHSATPAMRRIIDEANGSQNIYRFVLDFKPGGNQIIALKSMEHESSLAVIAPAFVENVDSGKLIESDYIPVHALGNACWAVVTNKPLVKSKEFVVGGVGFGNAAHLTALALGEKYKFSTRYVIFKSNFDALVNMAGNNGVEFVIDKYEGYSALKLKNPKLQMIAASCPTRLPQEPKIKTLNELGINAPYIFNITVAHKDMPAAQRRAIGIILDQATKKIGEREIFELSAMRPPIYDNLTTEQFYEQSITLVRNLQTKYKDKIKESSIEKQ